MIVASHLSTCIHGNLDWFLVLMQPSSVGQHLPCIAKWDLCKITDKGVNMRLHWSRKRNCSYEYNYVVNILHSADELVVWYHADYPDCNSSITSPCSTSCSCTMSHIHHKPSQVLQSMWSHNFTDKSECKVCQWDKVLPSKDTKPALLLTYLKVTCKRRWL